MTPLRELGGRVKETLGEVKETLAESLGFSPYRELASSVGGSGQVDHDRPDTHSGRELIETLRAEKSRREEVDKLREKTQGKKTSKSRSRVYRMKNDNDMGMEP